MQQFNIPKAGVHVIHAEVRFPSILENVYADLKPCLLGHGAYFDRLPQLSVSRVLAESTYSNDTVNV